MQFRQLTITFHNPHLGGGQCGGSGNDDVAKTVSVWCGGGVFGGQPHTVLTHGGEILPGNSDLDFLSYAGHYSFGLFLCYEFLFVAP